jgi:hypothetical protein
MDMFTPAETAVAIPYSEEKPFLTIAWEIQGV